MNLTLDNIRLRELIPGIIHEVEGEASLYDKILPWIETAKLWLEENFLGPDFEPASYGLYGLSEKIIVYRAFSDAIPSLDVTLSPAGFAVINTEGRAPASKERIERLIDSLRSSVDANVVALVAALGKMAVWRATDIGKWWCATLLPTLDEAQLYRQGKPLLETYRSMRDIAVRFEQHVSEEYLGNGVMSLLRDEQFGRSDYENVISMVRDAELRYISYHLHDQRAQCPDEHELWHMLRPAINYIGYIPQLKNLWSEEMGEKFRPEPFKNDIKGGFYF